MKTVQENEEWGNVRVRTALIEKIEGHIKKHPEYGNVSSFVSYVINQEIQK